MTQNKLLNLIMANITEDDFHKDTIIAIKPKQGYAVILISPITCTSTIDGYNTVYTLFSNMFSDKEEYPVFTIQDIINTLSVYERSNYSIVFNIYAYNGIKNECFVSVDNISESDIEFVKNDEVVMIQISIDYIKPIPVRS